MWAERRTEVAGGVFDCLVTAAAWTVPDGTWRREVVAVARRSGADEGIVGRGREVTSVVAFGLRLRSWRATTGSVRAAWSQGAALGAILLLCTAGAQQLARAVDGAEAGAAVLIVAGLTCAATGRLRAALALAALGLGVSVASQPGEVWQPAMSAQTIGLIALLAAHLTATRTSPTLAVLGGRAWLVTFVPAAVAVVVVGAPAAAAVTWAATLLIPAGLLILGGADARLAAAAVITWAWRFVALDPTDVVDAAVALGSHEGLDLILVRLAVMTSGVVVAVAVTVRSTRRAVAL